MAEAKAELAKQSATPAAKIGMHLILDMLEDMLNELDEDETEEAFSPRKLG